MIPVPGSCARVRLWVLVRDADSGAHSRNIVVGMWHSDDHC